MKDRVAASSVIDRLAASMGWPRGIVGRHGVALTGAGHFMSRKAPMAVPADPVSVLVGIAPLRAIDALQAVLAAKQLFNDPDELSAEELELILSLCPIATKTASSLFDALVNIIETLMALSDTDRSALAARLKAVSFNLVLCLEPASASLSWRSSPSRHSKPMSVAFAPQDPSPTAQPPGQGVERLVRYPFSVFVTAAEICRDARQAAAGKGPTSDSPSGSGDNGGEDNPSPAKTKAAGSGNHDGLFIGQEVLESNVDLGKCSTAPGSKVGSNPIHDAILNGISRVPQVLSGRQTDRFLTPCSDKGNRFDESTM